MLQRILGALVWLGFASAGSRRRRGEGKDRFRGPDAELVGILGEGRREIEGEGIFTRRENGSFRSRRSVERW